MRINFLVKRPKKRGDDTTATIYVRISDTHKVDAFSTTPLFISPNLWDDKNQCVKKRAVMDDELRQSINEQLAEFRLYLTREYKRDEYYPGWLKEQMRSFFNLEENTRETCSGKPSSNSSFFETFEKFLEQKKVSKGSRQHYLSLRDRLQRFELFMRNVKGNKLFRLNIHKFSNEDFIAFGDYVIHEYEYTTMYPKLFEAVPFSKFYKPRPMGTNSMIGSQLCLSAFLKWCYIHGETANHSYMLFEVKQRNYGTPYFLTKEERDQLAAHDFSDSKFPEKYTMERDTFLFQCLVGCRISDLRNFTHDNFHNGYLEYIPQKTKNKSGRVVRVPLLPEAQALLDKYKDENFKNERLFHFYQFTIYEEDLKEVFRLAGLNRLVTVRDSLTGNAVQKHMYELASTHLARRTFIGNLYKKVQDPNIIASMSGHVEGSKAFARYRTIDDDLKENVIRYLE